MTYNNYVNATYKVSGANNNGYTNYCNYYVNAGGYFYSNGTYAVYGVHDPFAPGAYSNYNNWVRSAPAAFNITSSAANFSQYEIFYASTMQSEINKLKQDLTDISVKKVKSNHLEITDGMDWDANYNYNVDSNFVANSTIPTKNGITEMTAKVKALWRAIRGEAEGSETGTWPDLTAANPTTFASDMTRLINNTSTLAGTAQTTGYLNCANRSNQTGQNGKLYSIQAKTFSAGVDTYYGEPGQSNSAV